MSFTSLWPISQGSLIAVAGGGGKTGLIGLLEEELHEAGVPAIATVTTRLGRDQLASLELVQAESLEEAAEAAKRAAAGQRILLGGPRREEGKPRHGIPGVPSWWFPRLRAEGGSDLVWLVEADGSAGLPVKAHRETEPALPPRPYTLVIVLGAEALSRPWREAVHRPEIFGRHVPLPETERPLAPEEIALFARKAWGRLEPDLIFLNQLDALPGSMDEAVRRLISGLAGFEIVCGSLYDRSFKRAG